MYRRVLPVLTAALLVTSSEGALAQSVRSYKDRDGVVHFTNLGSRRAGNHRHGKAGRSPAVPMALLEAVIAESADLYRIPPALVKAVIAAESNYNPWAISERGAIGLMQLMPQTAREMYVEDPFDPVQNIQGGVRYLRVLVNLFGGDLFKVLAAYNAGPEVVRRGEQRPDFVVPNIPETQLYVRRVLENYRTFQSGGQARRESLSTDHESS